MTEEYDWRAEFEELGHTEVCWCRRLERQRRAALQWCRDQERADVRRVDWALGVSAIALVVAILIVSLFK